MPTVFDKLNLKHQTEILVLNPPASFEPELAGLDNVSVRRSPAEVEALDFFLAFAIKQNEVDEAARIVAGKTRGDAVVWFAYPKGTSKKYECEFNRDTGWAALGAEGFEPVRQVAIDEDWSALRFRRVEYIKSMTRNKQAPISEQGKVKTAKK